MYYFNVFSSSCFFSSSSSLFSSSVLSFFSSSSFSYSSPEWLFHSPVHLLPFSFPPLPPLLFPFFLLFLLFCSSKSMDIQTIYDDQDELCSGFTWTEA